MAPVTPPHQIITGYDMNSSPSYYPEPTSRASFRNPAFTIPHSSYNNHSHVDSLSSSHQSHRSVSSDGSTEMTTTTTTTNATSHQPPPFEVPKLWQTAMSMVSINAGLLPQQVLQHYHKLYPLQAATHPGYTELDIWRSQRAKERGIQAIHVRYADGDPARVYLMLIFLEERDPRTKQPIIRLITNTSVRHVLEAPCANCPLWLPVRSHDNNHHDDNNAGNDGGLRQHDRNTLPPPPSLNLASTNPTTTTTTVATTPTTPYQIRPCCEEWVKSVDFDAPLSDEEKKVPGVVDRLVQELRCKNTLLAAKDAEVARLLLLLLPRGRHGQQQATHPHDGENHADKGVAATAAAGIAAFDAEAMVQYWWAAAAAVVFLAVLLFR